MYYKESRNVIRDVDVAIDALCKADNVIRRSTTATNADIEFSKDIYKKIEEIREIKNAIRSAYMKEGLYD